MHMEPPLYLWLDFSEATLLSGGRNLRRELSFLKVHEIPNRT